VSDALDERRYLRAVEAAWSKLLGRPAIVSPREFTIIDRWRRRGVPLGIVLEVLRDAGKRRSGATPRALTAFAHAVEEAWLAVAAGRLAPNPTGSLPARDTATSDWERAKNRCAPGTPLHALLTKLLAEGALGASGQVLDAALDASLAAAVPEEMRAVATEVTARALADFRTRMSDEEFQKTFARALADRLRAVLVLPRLTLTL